MRIIDNSDSEEEQQYGDAGGFESSTDEDEDVPPANAHGVDEQEDYLSSDDYSIEDEDEERDPAEEEAIYNDHVETVRQFVQPCASMGTQGWATEFTLRTIEDDNRIEDIADLINVILRKLIRDAKRNAMTQGYHGGWIGIGWESEHMRNTFIIPYGHEDHNNPRKLLTAFEGFDQSAKENDLYGQILRVQVSSFISLHMSPPTRINAFAPRCL